MSISVYTAPDRPRNEQEREYAVIRSGALRGVHGAGLNRITADARRGLGAAMAIVTIVYQDSAFIIAASGFAPGPYRRSTSFCAHAILTSDEMFVVPDARLDERFAGNPHVDRAEGIRFYAGVPLVASGGLAIGTLCVFDSAPRDGITADEARLLQRLATAAMRSFRN